MILPETGSVVIIDDRPNEALPLIQAFSKRGIATTYYQGFRQNDFPPTPVQVVRLVILDLQLFEGITDPHIIATNLIQVLKRLISEKNGPFLLLLWSKKENLYAENLKEELKRPQNNLQPSFITSLPKTDCLIQRNSNTKSEIIDDIINDLKGAFDEDDLSLIQGALSENLESSTDSDLIAKPDAIDIIEAAIETQLKQAGVFHLFVLWENLIKSAAAKTVSEVSKIVAADEFWEPNIRDVFKRMAVARLGRNEASDPDFLKESVLAFIQSFSERIETLVKEHKFPGYISLKGDILLRSRLNGQIFSLRSAGDHKYSIYRNEKSLIGPSKLEGLKSSIANHANTEERQLFAKIVDNYELIPSFLNASFHIDVVPNKEHMPGNVYIVGLRDPLKHEEFISTYLDVESIKKKPEHAALLEKIKFQELEVSPICDWAQRKWKKSRLVSGIIFPPELFHYAKSKNENLYWNAPIVRIAGESCRMVWDCHLLKSLDNSEVMKRKTELRLRRELLLDVISKISSHVNRPGIAIVE